MTETTTTNVNALDLTADHISKVVTVRGRNAEERLRGVLVELHFTPEKTDQSNGHLALGHINTTVGILFRGNTLTFTLGPGASLEIED